MEEYKTIEERIVKLAKQIKYKKLINMLDDLFNIPDDEDEITNLNNQIDNGDI